MEGKEGEIQGENKDLMPVFLKHSWLFLPMEFAGNHLGNQRSIATHPVVNNKINPVLVIHRLVYYWQNILDHLRVQHSKAPHQD